LLPLLVAVGCGGTSGTSASGSVVSVTERDFSISAPKVVPAGEMVLRVENQGPDPHELLVVRARNADLPLRSDGLTVSEEGLQPRIVGALATGEPQVVRDLSVRLKPGRYVLFCNMSGHFMGGMHALIVVR
jgi:Sulfocyanin (SoxE) domain